MNTLTIKAQDLQTHLGFEFNNINHLIQALTHRSFLKNNRDEVNGHNERLEFFGDAVLKLIVSEYVYHRYPQSAEGELTKIRAFFIADKTLGFLAQKINLGEFMVFSDSEFNTGGAQRRSNLANAFEAVLAAIYLDQGYSAVQHFYIDLIEKYWDSIKKECLSVDCKTSLQEYMQRHFSCLPIYNVEREEGPDHKKLFHVSVSLQLTDTTKVFYGSARSKKDAEQFAAEDALRFLDFSVILPV